MKRKKGRKKKRKTLTGMELLNLYVDEGPYRLEFNPSKTKQGLYQWHWVEELNDDDDDISEDQQENNFWGWLTIAKGQDSTKLNLFFKALDRILDDDEQLTYNKAVKYWTLFEAGYYKESGTIPFM